MATRLCSRSCASVSSSQPAKAAIGDEKKAASVTPSTESGGSEATVDKAKSEGGDEKKDEEEKTGWGMWCVYAMGWVSGLVFLYHFYREDYSVHRTEIAIVNLIRRLPLYYPAGISHSEANTTIDAEGLSPELVLAFTEWFITLDLQQSDGVIRDDVLELFREMGFDDNSKHWKRYLERGDGHLEERRRMSGTGLQESVSLLASLAFKPEKPEKLAEGQQPPTDPQTLVGPQAVETLRNKMRAVAPVMSGAQALQALSQGTMQNQMTSASASMAATPSATQGQPSQENLSIPPEVGAPPSFQGKSFAEEGDDEIDDSGMQKNLEDARLRRMEDSLMARLESGGTLSAAEEGRLQDIRLQRAALKT